MLELEGSQKSCGPTLSFNRRKNWGSERLNSELERPTEQRDMEAPGGQAFLLDDSVRVSDLFLITTEHRPSEC